MIQGIKLTQAHSTIGEDTYHKRFVIPVSLPSGSPDKYNKPFFAAINTCTVKKVIQAISESDKQITE